MSSPGSFLCIFRAWQRMGHRPMYVCVIEVINFPQHEISRCGMKIAGASVAHDNKGRLSPVNFLIWNPECRVIREI